MAEQSDVLQWAGTKTATVPQYMPIWSVMVSSSCSGTRSSGRLPDEDATYMIECD
jgi:hypothetical protein